MFARDWVSYRNGNYTVFLNVKDGTKIRYNKLDTMEASFPESIDVNITDKCTGSNCPYCYRGCTPKGKHAEILNSNFFHMLHPYTEIALGGGNVLEHPDLDDFLWECKKLNLIPSMTLNQKHFEDDFDRVKRFVDDKLVYGVGVSVISVTDKLLDKLHKIPNAVVHTIVGITPSITFQALKDKGIKVLVLGYKESGRGIGYLEDNMESIEGKMDWLKFNIDSIIKDKWFTVVSFDNLALKQLSIKEHVSEDMWDSFYMGDDGVDGELTSASMYVDLVGKTFARNSFSDIKHNMNGIEDPNEMFSILKGSKNARTEMQEVR